MIVDADRAGNTCHTALFNIGGTTATSRSWNVLITHYACGDTDTSGYVLYYFGIYFKRGSQLVQSPTKFQKVVLVGLLYNRKLICISSHVHIYGPNSRWPGCLQYYTATSNNIQNFGFPPTITAVTAGVTHLSNQHYDICIRRASGSCYICYR